MVYLLVALMQLIMQLAVMKLAVSALIIKVIWLLLKEDLANGLLEKKVLALLKRV